jgi:hypothetical protein
MDIRCPFCSEPWDIDELHDTDFGSFDKARKAFYENGCGYVFNNGKTCAPVNNEQRDRAMLSVILYDILGDDVDGIASMEADLDYFL